MKVELQDPALFSFDDSFAGLGLLNQSQPRLMARVRAAFEENRAFCQTHVRPLALASDLALQRDPSALATELLELALQHRRFTRFLPPLLGGWGDGTAIAPVVNAEETAAVDPGFVGVLSGHGLGMVALGCTMNLRVLDWFAARTVAGEKQRPAFLVDCAITEPNAGSDVEEAALVDHARLSCHAERVSDGAILRGRKCFISGGHFASHHVVIMPFDRHRARATMSVFLVPADTPGFSLGRLEHKMGQKAGPASELVFEDCLVPAENIVLDAERLGCEAFEPLLYAVLGATRIYVAAWATGIGRGAFEVALRFAQRTRYRGRSLLSQQFAQRCLIDMLANVHTSRAVYLQALATLLAANGGSGLPELTGSAWFRALYHSRLSRRLRHNPRVQRALLSRAAARDASTTARVQFQASLAKVVASDLAMQNCQRALELMGSAGLRHGAGAEKLFRDAKLCQIFEGTNQLNRLHMVQHALAGRGENVEVF